MGDIRKLFATDKRKEEEGVWVDDFGEGIRVRIARTNNPRYKKEFERAVKPRRRALRRGTLSEEAADKILIHVMAKTILLDWEGIEENGVPVPYSYENAVRLLTEYRDFRDQVNEIANEMEEFRLEDIEDAEKNSGKSSNGGSESGTVTTS